MGEHRPGRRAEVGARALSEGRERVVRVLPDQPAIDKTFDYLVPEDWPDAPGVGSMVRIALQGRRLGAWVLDDDPESDPARRLRPLAKLTGRGPAPDVVDLSTWAAWRWAGRRATFLRTASPPRAVRSLPAPPRVLAPAVSDEAALVRDAWRSGGVVRLAPAADASPLVAGAAARGNALVLAPSVERAADVARQLRRSGVAVALMEREWALAAAGAAVVGTRAAAWAPVVDLAAVVVLDEHDEVYQEERAPTWHARDVVVERARRAGVPVVLTSPCPSLEALGTGPLFASSRAEERAGWPVVDVIDRRDEEPGRSGLYAERLVALLRSGGRVLCVLNRKGRSRLLACAACGDLARCERCDAAVSQRDSGELWCPRCDATRPAVCDACGAMRMKNLRVGVSRAREELEALVGEPVGEASAAARGGRVDALPDTRVIVGTEALLHRAEGVREPPALVAFLDFDQELLAPRYRAPEQAFGLLARAARLLGERARGGRLAVQTRVPRHDVITAALHADPARLAAAESAQREALRFPPFAALAEVSGASAPDFVEAFGAPLGVEVLGPRDGRWLLRAPDHATLCDALAATPRPGGRLRVAVDPPRV